MNPGASVSKVRRPCWICMRACMALGLVSMDSVCGFCICSITNTTQVNSEPNSVPKVLKYDALFILCTQDNNLDVCINSPQSIINPEDALRVTKRPVLVTPHLLHHYWIPCQLHGVSREGRIQMTKTKTVRAEVAEKKKQPSDWNDAHQRSCELPVKRRELLQPASH